MKSKLEIARFSHSAANRANKLANESYNLKEEAKKKNAELKEFQDKIPNESNIKKVANVTLTSLAIFLLIGNVGLDRPVIQNLFNLQGNEVWIAYSITFALALSSMVFGIFIEEGFENHLSATTKRYSAISDHDETYGKKAINFKKWLICGLGVAGAIGMIYAVYKLNGARFQMADNLGKGNFKIEKAAIFLPVFLYSAETLASVSILGTIGFLHNLRKSKTLARIALQKAKEARELETQAYDLWIAYQRDLRDFNEQNDKTELANRPNKYLRRLLNDQDEEQLNTSDHTVQDVEVEENPEGKDHDDIERDDEYNDYGFEPITNKPI